MLVSIIICVFKKMPITEIVNKFSESFRITTSRIFFKGITE